jgi:hypothetical protein
MNFPKFWARANVGEVIRWGWSEQSMAEAQSLAQKSAQELAELLRKGDRPSRKGAYYPNRPFREQVLQEIKNDAGEIAAVVTRNSYGCLVLNTARVMFVDIDFSDSKPIRLLQMLFGKKKPPADTRDTALARIADWSNRRPEWGWRIYQTKAGLRLLATHVLVEPASTMSDEIFTALAADPLYRMLCQNQKCFRARLTPKPWRCGVRGKPARWPWLDARQERLFQQWQGHYESLAFNWATCKLIQEIGNPTVHPDVQLILKLHDSMTRVETTLPLA